MKATLRVSVPFQQVFYSLYFQPSYGTLELDIIRVQEANIALYFYMNE